MVMDQTTKLAALRLVLEDFRDRVYRLGTNDCASFVSTYLDLLEIPHGWKPGMASEIAPGSAYKTALRHLGPTHRGEPEIGDIGFLESDGVLFGILTGRGWASMTESDNLSCVQNEARRVWRI